MDELALTRQEKWIYILNSLLGGLDDKGVVNWLAYWIDVDDLDTMFKRAQLLRDGQIAT